VFTTPERSFEPTVMFFGLTNSLVTFQAMMNELLRDLVNMEKVVVFIDDIIINNRNRGRESVKIVDSGLHFYFLFSLYFIFLFFFYF